MQKLGESVMNNEKINKLLKLVDSFSSRHHKHEILSDCFEIWAICISQLVDKPQYAEREQRYLDIVKKYDKHDLDIISEMFAEVWVLLSNMPTDGFEEFIYKFSNTPILGNIDELPSNDSGLVGRSFRDVFPDVAEHLYPLFREVCNSGENQSLYVYIYEDDFLKDFYEINLIYDEDFFAVVLKETEKENLKIKEELSFDFNVNPICIIQDNSIVKANDPYFNLFDCPKNDVECLSIETLTESHVAYNDTGLVLTYPQMIEKIMSDEFLSITYKAVINVCGTLKCFQAVIQKKKKLTMYAKKCLKLLKKF